MEILQFFGILLKQNVELMLFYLSDNKTVRADLIRSPQAGGQGSANNAAKEWQNPESDG